VSNFNTSYDQLCGPGSENSTACLSLLFNETRSHFAFTDYLNRENEAVEDVLDSLENDWAFAVNQFTNLDPKVAEFISSNQTTMATLVNGLTSNASQLISDVNPVFMWSNKALQTLLNADTLDTVNFTNASDAAMQRLLYQAMSVGQIFPHQVNMYAKNSTAFADNYFNTEFFRVKNGINSKYKSIQDRIKAVQDTLTKQRSYISNQTNFLNVSLGQIDSVIGKTLSQRFSDLRSALMTTLRDRINQRLRSQASKQSSDQLANDLAAASLPKVNTLNTSFYFDMDSALDQIEDRMNKTIAVALAQARQSIMNFSSTNAVGVGSLTNIATLLAPFTSAAGEAAYPYMVSDADLGADSILQFRQKRDQIKAAIPTALNSIASLVKRITSQLDSYAFGVGVQLGRAMDAMSTTDSGQTAQGLTDWMKFSSDLYTTGIKTMMANFHNGLQAIQDAVLFRVTGATVGTGESLADASIKGLLGANLNFVPSEMLATQESVMASNRSVVFANAQAILNRMTSTLNSTGRALELSSAQQLADSSVSNSSNYMGTSLQDVRDDDAALMTSIELNQIDSPINQAIEAYTQVQSQVQSLVRRNTVVTSRLVDLDNLLTATAQNANRRLSVFDTSLATRARALENMFAQIGAEMDGAIRDYVSQYTASLPSATGLAQSASDRSQNISSIASYIRSSQVRIETLVDTQQRKIQSYLDGLTRASTEYNTAQSEIANRDSISAPDFASMNLQVRNLAQRFDAAAEWSKQQNDINAQVSGITKTFNDRNLEVTSALGNARKESTSRDTELAQVKSQFESKKAAFKLLSDFFNTRTSDVVTTLNAALDQYNTSLGVLKSTSESQMSLQESMLAEEIEDLLHQVKTAAPNFLYQYESEKVSDLLNRLRAINETLPTVVLSPPGTTGSSLLHRAEMESSPGVRALVELIHNKSDIEPLQLSTNNAIRSIEKSIRSFRSPNVTIPTAPDSDAADYMNASVGAPERLNRFVESSTERMKKLADRNSAKSEQSSKGNMTEIRDASELVSGVLRNASKVEQKDLRSVIGQLRAHVSNYNSSTSRWIDLASEIEKVVSFEPDKLKFSVNHTTFARTSEASEWFKRFVTESEAEVDRHIQEGTNKVNKTIGKIESIQNQLKTLVRAENQLESDFDNKVLAKLKARDLKVYQRTDEAIAELGEELNRLTK
jgi:hypothetical protein